MSVWVQKTDPQATCDPQTCNWKTLLCTIHSCLKSRSWGYHIIATDYFGIDTTHYCPSIFTMYPATTWDFYLWCILLCCFITVYFIGLNWYHHQNYTNSFYYQCSHMLNVLTLSHLQASKSLVCRVGQLMMIEKLLLSGTHSCAFVSEYFKTIFKIFLLQCAEEPLLSHGCSYNYCKCGHW